MTDDLDAACARFVTLGELPHDVYLQWGDSTELVSECETPEHATTLCERLNAALRAQRRAVWEAAAKIAEECRTGEQDDLSRAVCHRIAKYIRQQTEEGR